jgi:hypothetical protein
MQLPSDATEIKSVHVKSYVEPSVSNALEQYRKMHKLESTSAAIRQLIITGLVETG